jgi:L-rhamnose mutarotase
MPYRKYHDELGNRRDKNKINIDQTKGMRLGSLIKLKPEWEERYIILHKNTFPGVLDRIRKSNIRNYSIFLRDGMLFSFFEYIGDDYDGDMAKIGQDSVTREWWKLTDPMQEPLETRKEGEWWTSMDEVFHWNEKRMSSEKVRRTALKTRIIGGFEHKVIESLKIAYPILFATPAVTKTQNFSVHHKDGCLYSYFEYIDEDLGADIKKLQETLKVETELNWLPMKEIFHTD